uniref:Uncharacterized protein n=1 Tax=Astyanax mexicanus TaxID=7994 RepID=A0A3B1IXC8_ASTMX
MDSQIAKTTQSLTKAEEMRNQTKLIMQPYANWEEYLTPAPLSIAILGELVFISSKTDFSINKNPPKDGYKHIKYPDSFRACLMQVCNSGWGAFNEAHKNMDQIRLHTMNVPNYMKTAVKILFQGNDEVVQAHLPDQLENIRVIADDCLKLSMRSTAGSVCKCRALLWRRAGRNQEKTGGKQNQKTIIQKEAVKRSEKIAKAMEEEMKEAQESYKAAMDSIPSGWESMAMDLVAAVTESASTVVTGMTSVQSQPMIKTCNATKTVPETCSDTQGYIASADEVDKINIFSKSAAILTCAEIFQKFVHDSTIDWKSLYDQKKKTTKTDFVKGQFTRINSSLEKFPECKPKQHAQQICEEAIDICDELAIYAPKGEYVTKSPSLDAKPPMMNKEESKSEKKKCVHKAHQRELPVPHRAEPGECGEHGEEVKKIDFNTTIKMLVKGNGGILTRTLKDFVSSQKIGSTIKPSGTNIASLVTCISAPTLKVSEKYLRIGSAHWKLMVMDKEKPEYERGTSAATELL